VSVRRDRLGHVPAAYAAACELRERGLDFVLAPERGHNGRVVHPVGGARVVVFAKEAGRPLYPDAASAGQALKVRDMIAALHAHTVATELPAETFDMPFDDELAEGVARAVAGVDEAGPYGARVCALVRANLATIDARRAELSALQHRCRADAGAFVLTHGEPDRGNIMVRPDGSLLLMDWGALEWGPPERDLSSLPDLGLAPSGRAPFLRYYELFWSLGEVAEYVARFTVPHDGNAEDAEKWDELLLYLEAPSR
jgi:spectinomycin phosphotransferase